MGFRTYAIEEIPLWCHLPHSAHFDGIGGCWGISYNEVARKGEQHCLNCEYHEKNIHDDPLIVEKKNG